MDKMEDWELFELYNVIQYSDRNSWEQTRMMLSCHTNPKKVHKLQDIITFPWEKETTNNDYDNMTDEEKYEYRMKQRELLKKLHEKT